MPSRLLSLLTMLPSMKLERPLICSRGIRPCPKTEVEPEPQAAELRTSRMQRWCASRRSPAGIAMLKHGGSLRHVLATGEGSLCNLPNSRTSQRYEHGYMS